MWAVAFENLPGVELYPAVSLYHRDDCISLVANELGSSSSSPMASSSSVSDFVSASSAKESSPKATEAITTYLHYTQNLCAHVDGILRAAEEVESSAERAVVLSHPFIGMLLPSVAAAALKVALELQQAGGGVTHGAGGFLPVQLIPYFTVMAKRLSSLQESISNTREITGGKPLSACGFIGNISGLWVITSAQSPCSTIPSQKYKLNIDYPFTPLGFRAVPQGGSAAFDTSSKASTGSHYLAAARIAGSGRSSTVSVTLSGTQLGTRLKFLEKWSTGSGCMLDVRLSLCGSFFHGTYTDIKSGKSGDVEGCRMTPQVSSITAVREALSKSCLLSTMLCGKLSASLVSPQCPSFPFEAQDKEMDVEMDDTPIKRATDGDNEVMEEGEEEEKTVASSAISQADAKEKLHSTVLKWLRSDLFSGGLPMDVPLTRHLDEEIRLFISPQRLATSGTDTHHLSAPSTPGGMGLAENEGITCLQSIAETADSTHSFRGLTSWWLEKVFPTFVPNPKTLNKNKRSAQSLTESTSTVKGKLSFLSEDEPVSFDSFIHDLAENRGAGRRVDEYVSHHVGLSALSKMGGGHTQVARRLVVAALVKHSGCVSLCLAEEEALSSGLKIPSERPHQLLIDVWRSAQRCIEHAIRSKKGASFDSVGVMLGRKAELLLDLTPNSLGISVHDALAVTAAEIQRHHQQLLLCPQLTGERTEVPSEALEDSSKQLAEATEFLMCPLRDTAQLRSLLLTSSFHAVTRTAGLKAFMLLFNRIEEADAPSIGKLPALSAIGMQPAAIEYLFLAFRGLSDDIPVPKGTPSVPITPTVVSPVGQEVVTTTGLSGHYSDGLHGVNAYLMDDLKCSFESMFEFITQLLSR